MVALGSYTAGVTLLRHIVYRLVNSLIVLVIATMMIFVLVTFSGDPLGELKERQPPVPEMVIKAEEQRLGLDKPLVERYVNWVSGLTRGDLGPSVIENRDIGAEIASRIGVTLRLVGAALFIALGLSLVVGTLAALKQGKWLDRLLTPTSFLLLAMPSFWLATLLKQLGIRFNKTVGYQVFFTVGDRSVPPPSGVFNTIVDMAGHLILPTTVMILVHFAVWSRYQRTAVIESLAADHVKFAILKGLPKRRVIWAYVIRPALVPLITIVALDLPAMLSGVIITETVFQWRGMGSFLLESISLRDVNAVLAWLGISAAATVGFNFCADLAYGLLDPRVRDEH